MRVCVCVWLRPQNYYEIQSTQFCTRFLRSSARFLKNECASPHTGVLRALSLFALVTRHSFRNDEERDDIWHRFSVLVSFYFYFCFRKKNVSPTQLRLVLINSYVCLRVAVRSVPSNVSLTLPRSLARPFSAIHTLDTAMELNCVQSNRAIRRVRFGQRSKHNSEYICTRIVHVVVITEIILLLLLPHKVCYASASTIWLELNSIARRNEKRKKMREAETKKKRKISAHKKKNDETRNRTNWQLAIRPFRVKTNQANF